MQWFGYIKDYDGGTLMESLLHTELPYTNMPQMILAQKEELDRRIRGLSTAQTLYPGLTHFQQEEAQLLDVQDIPGMEKRPILRLWLLRRAACGSED